MKRIMFDVFLKEMKMGQRNWMIVMMNKKVISDFGRKKISKNTTAGETNH